MTRSRKIDNMRRSRIVVLIPYFNDQASLCKLIEQLSTASFALASDILLLIVDDGSVPPLENAIGEEFRSAFPCRVVTLKRNLGPARAIAIGLASAVNDDLAGIVVIIDADGEDNPTDISRTHCCIG